MTVPELTRLMIAVDQSDTAPASSLVEAFAGMCQESHAALARWSDLRTKDVPQLNAMLARQSLPPLTIPEIAPHEPVCGN